MSLRLRIVAAVILVFVLGAGIGLALAGQHASHWLRDEMLSAQDSARVEAMRAVAELPLTEAPERQLIPLIADFDGNRHLQAWLVTAQGEVLATSRPAPALPPPDWFYDLMRQDVPPVRLRLPAGGMIELWPIYANDMSAVWQEFVDLVLVLAVAMVGGAVLVNVVVGRALQPLQAVGEVLPRIGRGDYAARAPTRGPPEVGRLSRGVNEMAGRLAAMRERNRTLEEQMLTLQDEERADIARDLHDEIGPHLFAANVDAAAAASLIGSGRPEAALEQVRAIAGAIGHIQRLVRDILQRLRPTQLTELGLASAIEDLVAFWKARRPEITFSVALGDETRLSEPLQETLYRIVQESLSNAVRHGQPREIRIVMQTGAADVRLGVVNDGAEPGESGPGYGLTGMAERVAAGGGRLSAGPTTSRGWRVEAVLPLAAPAREEAA
ncbi:MAG TPA: histidine kinase [Caulobacteraceae bacterium]|jgi:two-component system sensor histidine kinase UhpB|nr:histidine kinase [Caulobacteraceae bacterium]